MQMFCADDMQVWQHSKSGKRMFQSAMQMFCADDHIVKQVPEAEGIKFQSAMQMFCADDGVAGTVCMSATSFNLRCRCFALMT